MHSTGLDIVITLQIFVAQPLRTQSELTYKEKSKATYNKNCNTGPFYHSELLLLKGNLFKSTILLYTALH